MNIFTRAKNQFETGKMLSSLSIGLLFFGFLFFFVWPTSICLLTIGVQIVCRVSFNEMLPMIEAMLFGWAVFACLAFVAFLYDSYYCEKRSIKIPERV